MPVANGAATAASTEAHPPAPRPWQNRRVCAGFMLKLRPIGRFPDRPFQRARTGRPGQPRGEKGIDRLRQRRRRARAPDRRGQMLEVALGRHVAELDQHRGHVRRFEHLEARRLDRVQVQRRAVLSSPTAVRANCSEKVLVSRCARSIRILATSSGSARQIDAGDHVRPCSRLRPAAPLRRRRRAPTACRRWRLRAWPSLRGR